MRKRIIASDAMTVELSRREGLTLVVTPNPGYVAPTALDGTGTGTMRVEVWGRFSYWTIARAVPRTIALALMGEAQLLAFAPAVCTIAIIEADVVKPLQLAARRMKRGAK